MSNPICFVIQPFDGGRYDKRYNDIYEKAIKSSGLEPYRVDMDPSVSIPIQDIEDGIRRASLCFADITPDNPNVWFELGFAFSAGKQVVMVCAEERQKFPFDVQHRNIIRYKSEAPSDFIALEQSLSDRLRATLARVQEIGVLNTMGNNVELVQGMNSAEVAAIVIICTHYILNKFAISSYLVGKEMDSAGYTDAATALSLRLMEKKGLVAVRTEDDTNGEYLGFYPTDRGLLWFEENQDKLKLRKDMPSKARLWSDDDLPF